MTVTISAGTLARVHRGTSSYAELRFGTVVVPLLDVFASGALLALAVILGAIQPTSPAQYLGTVIAALSPLARRRSPATCAGLLLGGLVLIVLGGPLLGGSRIVDCSEMIPAVCLLLFAAGAHPCRRQAAWIGALAFVALCLEMLQDPIMGPGAIVLFAPFALAVWLAGRGAQLLRGKAEELEHRNAELIQQRTETSRLAVKLERGRVGSELQATISEGLSAMLTASAQARAGERPLAEALAGVEEHGRQVLDDMRGVLGILRQHTDGPLRAPQPSLRDLDRLLAQARARGVEVSLRHEGAERPVADVPDRSAYRIIERALERTPANTVEVCLRWRERELEVEIQPGDEAGWPSLLAAARERAAPCGGRVATLQVANARPARLRAHLPLAGVRA